MQSGGGVDVVDEVWQIGSNIIDGFVFCHLDRRDLQLLHEAFGFCTITTLCSTPHTPEIFVVRENAPMWGPYWIG